MFVSYLAYVAHYGVNVAFGDDWHIVKLNENLHAGTLHFGQLWAQHNAHRILVPNIVGLVLGSWFRFDVKIEMYAGVGLLALVVASIVSSHRFLTGRPLYHYAPIVLLVFTPVQWQNTLWGFQVASYFVLASLAGAAYALCRFRSRWGLAAAIALAVAASFSSLEGLFTWPVLAPLLWSGSRSRATKITWIAAGVVTTVVYFYNFDFRHTGGAGISVAITHPVATAKLFLVVLGGFGLGVGGLGVAAGLGLIVLLLGLTVLTLYVRSSRRLVAALPATLVLYALMFDLSVAIGRNNALGAIEALAPRYVTFNLLMFVAFYLSMLDAKSRRAMGSAAAASTYAFAAAASGLVLVLVLVSATTAISEGRAVAASRRAAQAVLVNYQVSTDRVISRYLYGQAKGSPVVRSGGRFLEQQDASVFADPSLVESLRGRVLPSPNAPGAENAALYRAGGEPGLAIWGRYAAYGGGPGPLVGALVVVPWLVAAGLWQRRRRVSRA